MHTKPPEPATSTPHTPSGPEAASELVVIATALSEGRLPPPAIAARFAAGVSRWLVEGRDLEEALGLAGAVGVESARTQLLRRSRDMHLRAAYDLIAPGATPWKRSQALAREIATFLSRIWPSWRHRAAPPPEASSLRSHLFTAARSWPLPSSAVAIHDICFLKST